MAAIKKIARLITSGDFAGLRYLLHKRLKRLDLSVVSLEDLGLSGARSHIHRASGGPDLVHVFENIDIPTGSRLLDLGSGKGGAVITASKFPFIELAGVEVSQNLVHIAEANIARMRLRRVHFLCLDAGKFADLDRFTHIYMYCPFPSPVVKEVLDNLAASLNRVPRQLTLIYVNPLSHDIIMKSGLFEQTKRFEIHVSVFDDVAQDCYIYVHQP